MTKKTLSLLFLLPLLVIGFLLINSHVNAQEIVCVSHAYHTVKGHVTYLFPSGKIKPAQGAKVKAQNLCNVGTYTTQVGIDGAYSLTLPDARYKLSVSDKDNSDFSPSHIKFNLASDLYGVDFQAPVGPKVSPIPTITPTPTPRSR